LTASSGVVRGNGLLGTNQLTIPWLKVDTRLVIWQGVKTNSTPGLFTSKKLGFMDVKNPLKMELIGIDPF
jgi:hypothetical protein